MTLQKLLSDRSREFDLEKHSIILAYRGSIVHGTYRENHIDDIDIMGIVIPPKEYTYGLKSFGSRGTKEIMKDEWDIVLYEVNKFVRLLRKNNPNVMNLLWLPKKHYINVSEVGQLLINNREIFSSKAAYKTFAGYAREQLRRVQKKVYKGYMGKKRKALTDEYGYDTKHAAHCIRILRTGIDFLERGELFPDRTGLDASQLKDIKYGNWSLERVQDLAESLFVDINNAMDKTQLPEEPDYNAINNLMIQIYEKFYNYN